MIDSDLLSFVKNIVLNVEASTIIYISMYILYLTPPAGKDIFIYKKLSEIIELSIRRKIAAYPSFIYAGSIAVGASALRNLVVLTKWHKT